MDETDRREAAENLLPGFEEELEEVEAQLTVLTSRAQNLRLTIQGIRGLVSGRSASNEVGASPATPPADTGLTAPMRPRVPALRGKEAVLHVLEEAARPLTAEQILAALEQTAMAPEVKNPLHTVQIHLGRAVSAGEALKLGRGTFGLPAWLREGGQGSQSRLEVESS